MRCGIIVIALLTLLATPTLAITAYDDVPKEHWSYHALDYLSRDGFLVGYPEGFFDSDRLLTRYEFAQAIARLLDSIGGESYESEIAGILAEALKDEYKESYDQVREATCQIPYSGTIPSDNWQYEYLGFLVQKGFLPASYATQLNGSEEFYNSELKKYAELVKHIFDLRKPDSVPIEDWITALGYASQLLEEHHLYLADNSYSFVLPGQWSYKALDFLGNHGIPEDYLEGYYKGRKTLTRYEMAHATARLLDSIGAGPEEEIVEIFAEILREEYSYQLGEINQVIIELSNRVQRSPPD